jgi:hypothetical protein
MSHLKRWRGGGGTALAFKVEFCSLEHNKPAECTLQNAWCFPNSALAGVLLSPGDLVGHSWIALNTMAAQGVRSNAGSIPGP